ncbi:uncharacterized protein LOC120713860 [Panicum virgatum]|uniref:uncharacterized protein LOC120713860 n=1 Tax=Panicum virgatum TaxID=38727 RepID=UPI0019D4FB3A|nr:uncharacterized protein LOC120713860 [Panicum virgatum]
MSSEACKRKVSASSGGCSPRPEKRGRESSSTPVTSPVPSVRSAPASGAITTSRLMEPSAGQAVKESGTLGTTMISKLLKSKKLPSKKRTHKGADLGLGVSEQTHSASVPGPNPSEVIPPRVSLIYG